MNLQLVIEAISAFLSAGPVVMLLVVHLAVKVKQVHNSTSLPFYLCDNEWELLTPSKNELKIQVGRLSAPRRQTKAEQVT